MTYQELFRERRPRGYWVQSYRLIAEEINPARLHLSMMLNGQRLDLGIQCRREEVEGMYRAIERVITAVNKQRESKVAKTSPSSDPPAR